ncbi:MAG TPA: PAS domain-containing sensor histidine kinase [Blastocatellia bacterium]|nr:PAS domain-containing sensor histidine kinase [Blastocatellia bacterium]
MQNRISPSPAHEPPGDSLLDSGQLFRAAFDSALDAMLIADDEGNYVDANPAACALFGVTRDKLLSSNLSHFVEPDREAEMLQAWHAFIEAGEQKGLFRILRPDGELLDLEYNARANILPGRHLSILRNVTDRQRTAVALSEQADELAAVIRIGRMLSAELDVRKIVQALTDAATELTGARFGSFFYNVVDEGGESYMLYTLSGVPIEHFKDFPMPRATEIFGPTFRGEGVIRLADVRKDPRYGRNSPYHGIPPGHLPVVSYLAVPVVLRSGEVVGGLFFGHPEPGVFTERAERIVVGLAPQAAVAIENARLYQQAQRAITERDQLLAREQAARADAEAANRAKDEFLATVSHELRTPLNAILGWARMLRMGRLDDETQTRALETIERNARLQAQIVEDILDVSQIVTGKLRLKSRPLELASVIKAAIDSLRQAADDKMIQITSSLDESPAVICGDADRLQQVVWNLLANAIKFTPEGGRITVKLERDDDHAQIIVSDTGQGIRRDFLPFAFERFRQADSTSTRTHGGLGLGLAIVRHIVEMHGGSVKAESLGEGSGATFTVTLPLIREAGASPAQRDATAVDVADATAQGES